MPRATAITFCNRPLTEVREVIMLQLPLLSLMGTGEELVPVNVPARAELVALMAQILVTVFQPEVRTDERASVQSQD